MPALTVTACDPGIEGNMLRVEIDYDTVSPEETFNLTVFRSELQDDGTRTRGAEETYAGLSMNPNAGNFADTAVNGASALVTVTAQSPAAPVDGLSIAGLVLPSAGKCGPAGADRTRQRDHEPAEPDAR